MFLDFYLHFGDWIVGGCGSGSRHSLLVHHKLGEVPFDGVDQEPGLLLLQDQAYLMPIKIALSD